MVNEICSPKQGCFDKCNRNFQAPASGCLAITPDILPYGIRISIDQLNLNIQEYINALSKYPLSAAELIDGDTPQIIWRILGAICRFHNVNPIAREVSIYLKY